MNINITLSLLKILNFNNLHINFFKNNFPEILFPNGLNLSEIKITGDYEYFFTTIFDKIIKIDRVECDKNKNIRKIKYFDGIIEEYDLQGNIISKVSNEKNITYNNVYDKYNNLILFDLNIKDIRTNEIYNYREKYDLRYGINLFNFSKYLYEKRKIKKVERYNYNGDIIYELYLVDKNLKPLKYNYKYDKNKNIILKYYSNYIVKYIYNYDNKGRLIFISKDFNYKYNYTENKNNFIIKYLD